MMKVWTFSVVFWFLACLYKIQSVDMGIEDCACPIKQALQWHTLVFIKYKMLFLELMILFLSQALDVQ